MTLTTSTFLADDLANGTVTRVTRLSVIDGTAGWAIVTCADGTTWAYAPQHVALATGEAARQLA